MDHFYKKVDHAEARKVDIADRESGVRVYCMQHGGSWALQVRTPIRLANGTEGKDYIVATASLDKQTMVELRDAIDAILEETS